MCTCHHRYISWALGACGHQAVGHMGVPEPESHERPCPGALCGAGSDAQSSFGGRVVGPCAMGAVAVQEHVPVCTHASAWL